MLSQVRPDQAKEADFVKLDDAVRRLKTAPVELRFNRPDEHSLRLYVYADASFTNNPDLTSHIGFVSFLVDKDGACCLLSYSSHKCRRVTRSELAEELYALTDAYDHGHAMRHSLETLFTRKIPLYLFTDSKTLFASITNWSR
jgi:hypothetical protein